MSFNQLRMMGSRTLESDLLSVAIGGKLAPIELSETKVRIKNLDVIGDFTVDGEVQCDDINVQYDYIRSALDYNQSAGTFVTIMLDGGTRPKTTFVGNLETTCMIAPHNGTLEFISFRSEEVAGNPVIIGFHKASDGTEVPSDSPTESKSVDMSAVADDTTTKFDFTTGSNAFSAGDVLGFSIDPANDINDCLFVICLKYDTTT